MVTPFPFIERSISQTLLLALAEQLVRLAKVESQRGVGEAGPEVGGLPPASQLEVLGTSRKTGSQE